MVQHGGTYKVAQYGQWDGYPEGQGQTVVKFLNKVKTKKALAEFTKKVAALVEISNDELQARWKSAGADGSGWVGMDVANKFKEKWPHLSRDCGAEVLNHIANGTAKDVSLDTEFTKDSLFCEWAYVIDLDAGTFEVYKGFNTEPVAETERFYHGGHKDKEYYPVRLLKKYSLSKVPTVKAFLSAMKKLTKDE